MENNRISKLFNIKFPIIQAGMVWCSGWKLASAVSNSGGLGLIGSGSMTPELLRKHIIKCKNATSNPFGVNVPLIYPRIDETMKVIIDENIKIVFTSAGNPDTWTLTLKQEGIKVVHVVSSLKFGLKSQDAGIDAVVAEGFEAGGHNGRDETTTFCLVPLVSDSLDIPVIAAGGISTGKTMLAAFALGAEAVQIGSRFAITPESSAHINFKNRVIDSPEGATILAMKDLTPVRLIKNEFYRAINKAESEGASKDDLIEILGTGRARNGIFEGDLENGELEIGQVSANIHDLKSAKEVVNNIWNDFNVSKQKILALTQ